MDCVNSMENSILLWTVSVLWRTLYCYGLCQFYGEQYTVMNCVSYMGTVCCYGLCLFYGNSILLWTVSVLWEQYTVMNCVSSMGDSILLWTVSVLWGTVYCYGLSVLWDQYTVMDCVCLRACLFCLKSGFEFFLFVFLFFQDFMCGSNICSIFPVHSHLIICQFL